MRLINKVAEQILLWVGEFFRRPLTAFVFWVQLEEVLVSWSAVHHPIHKQDRQMILDQIRLAADQYTDHIVIKRQYTLDVANDIWFLLAHGIEMDQIKLWSTRLADNPQHIHDQVYVLRHQLDW